MEFIKKNKIKLQKNQSKSSDINWQSESLHAVMIVILYLCFGSDTRILRRDDSECEKMVDRLKRVKPARCYIMVY